MKQRTRDITPTYLLRLVKRRNVFSQLSQNTVISLWLAFVATGIRTIKPGCRCNSLKAFTCALRSSGSTLLTSVLNLPAPIPSDKSQSSVTSLGIPFYPPR